MGCPEAPKSSASTNLTTCFTACSTTLRFVVAYGKIVRRTKKEKSVVRVRRLELLWVAPLEPKSSASTNFAIPACF